MTTPFATPIIGLEALLELLRPEAFLRLRPEALLRPEVLLLEAIRWCESALLLQARL